MSRGRPERAGAIGGIGFTVCALASTAVVPQPPAFDAGAAEIREYLTRYESGLSIAALLACAAALFFLLFVAMAGRRIAVGEDRSEYLATAFLVAGTAAGAMALLGGLWQSALVNRVVPSADDSTLISVYALGQLIFYSGAAIAMVIALGVAAVATLRYGSFTKTTAWIAVAAALLGGLSSAWEITSNDDAMEAVGFLGFILTNVWLVWVSVSVLRRATADDGHRVPAGSALQEAVR